MTTTVRRPAPPAHTSKAAETEAKRVQAANAKAASLRAANAASLKAAQAHAAEKDAAVLNGVAAPAKPARARKAAPAKPAAKAAGKPASAARGKAAPARPAPGPGPAPATADGNRLRNQVLARRLVTALAAEFGKDSTADQVKVANWVKHLPTGDPTGRTDGAAGNRFWPKGLARPTTADWARP